MSAETGWLIERSGDDGRTEWFVGDNALKFTKDASGGMRFARAQDACVFAFQFIHPLIVADLNSRGGGNVRNEFQRLHFTEHNWS